MNSNLLTMALAVVISGFIVFALTVVFAAIHGAAPQEQRSYSGNDYAAYDAAYDAATRVSNEPMSPGAALVLRLIALPMLLLLGGLLVYVLMQST